MNAPTMSLHVVASRSSWSIRCKMEQVVGSAAPHPPPAAAVTAPGNERLRPPASRVADCMLRHFHGELGRPVLNGRRLPGLDYLSHLGPVDHTGGIDAVNG